VAIEEVVLKNIKFTAVKSLQDLFPEIDLLKKIGSKFVFDYEINSFINKDQVSLIKKEITREAMIRLLNISIAW
jgi:hypothetical protein